MGQFIGKCVASVAAISLAAFGVAAEAREQSAREFNITAPTLGEALLQFGLQTGMTVVFQPGPAMQRHSRPIVGRFAPDRVLDMLLRGSSLTAKRSGSNLIVMPVEAEAPARPAERMRLHQPARPQGAADDEAQGAAGQLQDIVVTAQRREEKLLDVPVAVSAIQADMLEQRQITDVSSLQQLAPSLSTAPFGDATTPLLSIRGQVAQDIVATVDPAVGVYLDGVYLGRATGANLSFMDVDRVEVLRGPQGTLFGRNTIGGAISIVPKHPTDVFEGQISARYGNFDQFGVTGIVNLPLADGVAARIVASHQQHDGFAESSVTGAELSAQNLEYLRGSLSADLSPDWNVLVSGDFSDSRNNGQWLTLMKTYPAADQLATVVSGGTQTATQFVDPFTRHPASETSGPFVSRNWGASGIVSGRIGAVNVKSITAYREVKRRLDNFDQDSTPFQLLHIFANDSDQHQFSQELQLYGKALDDRLDWIVGAYYFSEVGRDTVVTRFFYPFFQTIGITDAKATNRNFALYGQLTYDITDQLSAFAGLRYARDTRRLDLYSRTSGATPDDVISCSVTGAVVPDCAFALPKKSFDYVPLSVGLNYKPSQSALIYLKWSRGFRSGGYNSRGSTTNALLPFDPEKVDSYELGAKLEIARKFRVSAAVFQSDFSDMQLLAGVPGGPANAIVGVNQNAGKSRIRGLELEGEAALGQLRLNGSLAITDAEFRKLLPNVIDLTIDSPFTYTPKTTWSLGADYTVPADFGDIVLHGDYSWRSRAYFVATPPLDPINQQKSYGLLNASATVNVGDDLSFSLFGKNLANKHYITRTTNIVVLGFVNAYPGDPRTYGVSANYRF